VKAGLALSALLLSGLAACDIAVDEEAAPAQARAGEARLCPHCGWIESKREILPEVADPGVARVYEYTLRRANGALSVFREPLPVTWRLGERVVVIDGISPPVAR